MPSSSLVERAGKRHFPVKNGSWKLNNRVPKDNNCGTPPQNSCLRGFHEQTVRQPPAAFKCKRLSTRNFVQTLSLPQVHLCLYMKVSAMRLQFRAESLWKERSRCVILADSERVGTPKTDMPMPRT